MSDGYNVPSGGKVVVLAPGALGLWLAEKTVQIPGLTAAFSSRAKMAFTFGNLFSFGSKFLSPYSQVVCVCWGWGRGGRFP